MGVLILVHNKSTVFQPHKRHNNLFAKQLIADIFERKVVSVKGCYMGVLILERNKASVF